MQALSHWSVWCTEECSDQAVYVHFAEAYVHEWVYVVFHTTHKYTLTRQPRLHPHSHQCLTVVHCIFTLTPAHTCVVGSPMLCAATVPMASPGLAMAALKRSSISPTSQSNAWRFNLWGRKQPPEQTVNTRAVTARPRKLA